jgi:hypothetical protein
MPGFITSTSTARRHGAYAIEVTPPAAIVATGTGIAAYVAQFPWGPDGVVTTPTSLKDLYNTFAPRGMARTGSGYLGLIAKGFPTLRVVRVLGSGKAKATCPVPAVTPNFTITAKYNGVAGNSITATVANASDGDANHCNVTVAVTGASGTTSETFVNWNFSATGTKSTPTFTTSLLVGSVAAGTSGRPTNGSYSFSSGADGTINSGAYTGTAGSGDLGIAALEGDTSIRHVFADDCGTGLRAAVNAALVAHATLMGDRVAYLNGDSTLSLAATASDKAAYSSKRSVYVDPWVYILDDVDGTSRLVPPAPFVAAVAANLSPSTSVSWKHPEVKAMLSGIASLETDRGQGACDNSDAGIVTIIRENTGGYTLESAHVTSYPADPSTGNLTRTRVGDYIATSFIASTRSFIDAPNVSENQNNIIQALDRFMSTMERNQNRDPNHTPYVSWYRIGSLSAVNSQADLDAGILTIPLDVKVGSSIEKLFLSVRYGEGVVVSK